jgi:hypothetical protein
VVLTLALIAAGILAIRPGVFHVAPRPAQSPVHDVVQDVAPAPDDGV